MSRKTLKIGTAVIRLADEHPEAFLVKIPLSAVKEGSVSDKLVRKRMACYYTDTSLNRSVQSYKTVIPHIPPSDRNKENIKDKNNNKDTHPPSPRESQTKLDLSFINKSKKVYDSLPEPPGKTMNREEIRFLADIASRPLSATVSRYQRLNLSRRRGNAVRQHLALAGIIEAVTIATRSGQVVLYQLTDLGRSACSSQGIEPGPRSRESLEHSFWVSRAAKYFESKGYDVSREHPVKGNGAIDILAKRGSQKVAIEIETGKSDIKANLNKITGDDFDKIVLVPTSPVAVTACQKAIDSTERNKKPQIEQLTWFDIS